MNAKKGLVRGAGGRKKAEKEGTNMDNFYTNNFYVLLDSGYHYMPQTIGMPCTRT
jgi:hypothetical protein